MSGMSNHSAYVKICVRLYLTYSGKVCMCILSCMYVCMCVLDSKVYVGERKECE